MKRPFSIVVAFLLCFLASCTPGTPGSAVKAALHAANEGKYAEATARLSIQKREILEKASPKVAWDDLSRHGQISEIAITKEAIAGAAAKVQFTIQYKDGDTSKREVDLIQENGIWKIDSLHFLKDPRSKAEIAQSQVRKLKAACKTFFNRHQQWPQEISYLVNPNFPDGPILEDPQAILDPWGKTYQLKKDASGPVVFTKSSGTLISSLD